MEWIHERTHIAVFRLFTDVHAYHGNDAATKGPFELFEIVAVE